MPTNHMNGRSIDARIQKVNSYFTYTEYVNVVDATIVIQEATM